jgi:hypothetical protein
MGRTLPATALLAGTIALLVSGCGGSDGSTVARVVDHNRQATKHKPSHAFMIDGNDPAFRMFCHANNNPAARTEGLHAVMHEIRSSPRAPAHLNTHEFAHELKGLCGARAGPPSTTTPSG